jgi:hypothetical protein
MVLAKQQLFEIYEWIAATVAPGFLQSIRMKNISLLDEKTPVQLSLQLIKFAQISRRKWLK